MSRISPARLAENDNCMRELAARAIDAQCALNLIGLVHSFSDDITRLRLLLRDAGLDDTNVMRTHPVCVLLSTTGNYKVVDLESFIHFDVSGRPVFP